MESYLSPKTAKRRPSKIHGNGFFAVEDITRGEVLAGKMGHFITGAQLVELSDIINHSEIQVADGLYLAPRTPGEMEGSMIYFNHSCNPNAGIGGNILIVAMRDIAAGEEITSDYALWNTGDHSGFTCTCGDADCRGSVTGLDWQNPDLQRRYRGYFSWYVQKLIDDARR